MNKEMDKRKIFFNGIKQIYTHQLSRKNLVSFCYIALREHQISHELNHVLQLLTLPFLTR